MNKSVEIQMRDHEKSLDRISGPVLYKAVRAVRSARGVKRKLSMMMTRTYKEHSMKWQPSAVIDIVVCSLGQTLSTPNIFDGRLGKESVNSRYIRH